MRSATTSSYCSLWNSASIYLSLIVLLWYLTSYWSGQSHSSVYIAVEFLPNAQCVWDRSKRSSEDAWIGLLRWSISQWWCVTWILHSLICENTIASLGVILLPCPHVSAKPLTYLQMSCRIFSCSFYNECYKWDFLYSADAFEINFYICCVWYTNNVVEQWTLKLISFLKLIVFSLKLLEAFQVSNATLAKRNLK